MFYKILIMVLITHFNTTLLSMEKTAPKASKATGLQSPNLALDSRDHSDAFLAPLSRTEIQDTLSEFRFQPYQVPETQMAGGLPREIQNIIQILRNPERFRQLGLVELPSGILLHGPSGTGKSTLAQIIATATGRLMAHVYSSTFITSFQASGAQRIRRLFEEAANLNEPVIIFIDEIDGIANTELRGSEGEATRAIHEIHNQLGLRNPNIFVILATNNYDKIPASIKDRFSNHTTKIDLPDQLKRCAILRHFSANVRLTVPPPFFNQLARDTAGLSCRVLENIVQNALIIAGQRDPSATASVIADDFLVAALNTQKSRLPDSTQRQLLLRYYALGKTPLNLQNNFISKFAQESEGWDADKIEKCVTIANSIALANNSTHILENHLLLATALTDTSAIPNQERKRLLFNHLAEGKPVVPIDPFFYALSDETEGLSTEQIETIMSQAQDIAASRSSQTITRDHIFTACLLAHPQSPLNRDRRILYLTHLTLLKGWQVTQSFLSTFCSELDETTLDDLKVIIDKTGEIATARLARAITGPDLLCSDFYIALYLSKKEKVIPNHEYRGACITHLSLLKGWQLAQSFSSSFCSGLDETTLDDLKVITDKTGEIATARLARAITGPDLTYSDFYVALYLRKKEKVIPNHEYRAAFLQYIFKNQTQTTITDTLMATLNPLCLNFTAAQLETIMNQARDIVASRSSQTITHDHILTACLLAHPQTPLNRDKRILYLSHLSLLKGWQVTQSFLSSFCSELDETTLDDLKVITDKTGEIATARLARAITGPDLLCSDFYIALYLRKKEKVIPNDEHRAAFLQYIFKNQTQTTITDTFMVTLNPLCVHLTAAQLEDLITKTCNFAFTRNPSTITFNQEDFYMALYEIRLDLHQDVSFRERIIRHLLSIHPNSVSLSAITIAVKHSAGFSLNSLQNIFKAALNEVRVRMAVNISNYEFYIGLHETLQPNDYLSDYDLIYNVLGWHIEALQKYPKTRAQVMNDYAKHISSRGPWQKRNIKDIIDQAYYLAVKRNELVNGYITVYATDIQNAARALGFTHLCSVLTAHLIGAFI